MGNGTGSTVYKSSLRSHIKTKGRETNIDTHIHIIKTFLSSIANEWLCVLIHVHYIIERSKTF